jgi:hypothetical protein
VHVVGDLLAAAAGFADGAGDLAGGGGLFLDGGGDRVLEVGDLVDDREDPGDRVDAAGRVVLDRLDLGGDVLGGLRGLLGEFLDLVGDDGEALAGSRRRVRPRWSR